MADYLKRVALRGAGVVTRVHSVPFKHNPFAFSKEENSQDMTAWEVEESLDEHSTPEPNELRDAGSGLIDEFLKRPGDSRENILTYEIPSFEEDANNLKGLSHRKSSSEEPQHMSRIIDGTEDLIPTLDYPSSEDGRLKSGGTDYSGHPEKTDTLAESSFQHETVGRDASDGTSANEYTGSHEESGHRDRSSDIARQSEKDSETIIRETSKEIATKTNNTTQGKPKPSESEPASSRSDDEHGTHYPEPSPGALDNVITSKKESDSNSQRKRTPELGRFTPGLALESERRDRGNDEIDTDIPKAKPPKPKSKKVAFDSHRFSGLSEEVPIFRAGTSIDSKHSKNEVKVSVGRLEVHVEGERELPQPKQETGDGLERYWLQRNYFRFRN